MNTVELVRTDDKREVTAWDSQVRSVTPMDMLDRALATGAGTEVLEKLLALQERWEASQARKAFDAAIAAAKAEIPVITKNRQGHNNKRYADFAALASVVDPIIGQHGLSYRFRTVQNDKINVTCILSHAAGHYEETTLCGPADATGSKNAIQAIGSTLTYLQRYTLTQALGLAASEDDDGKTAGAADAGPITEEQATRVRALIKETQTDEPAFLRWLDVESVEAIPAGQMKRVEDSFAAKKRRMAS
jgi:hypothetical protein